MALEEVILRSQQLHYSQLGFLKEEKEAQIMVTLKSQENLIKFGHKIEDED